VRGTGKRSPVSREELEVLVRGYHHLLEEHRRARAESRIRRHMETRLRELELRFEELLDEWVTDEEPQAEWRAHLHGDAPEPSRPVPGRPLLFRGRGETGSVVEIRREANGDSDVELDGHIVERLKGMWDLRGEEAPATFALDRLVFREVFCASEPALAALDEFVAEREPHPPWRFAAELAADGLVDRDFGLTHRGHRALAWSRVGGTEKRARWGS
jgi:hypothetical protein